MAAVPARIDLARLEVFLEAARTGNYTTAARQLHVTQSAVSHTIRKLQEGVGRTLIEWRGRSLSLTGEGEYLYQVCQRVFHDLAEAEQRLSMPDPELTRSLTVGATVEFGATVLVQKIRPLLDATPWLHVDFRFLPDLVQPLLHDEIDLAVDCRGHTHPSVHATGLFREKYVVVAAPGFLGQRPLRRPIDLARVPVLSLDKEGAWWQHMLRALPGRHRPVFAQIIEINQIRGMVQAAIHGYGVALVPKYTVLGELDRGVLVVLFPRLRLREDLFSVYQKRSKVGREQNRLLTDYLVRLDVREFGDAIAGTSVVPAARTRARSAH
jgi:DNA-binding transcriptional LysR family regulator